MRINSGGKRRYIGCCVVLFLLCLFQSFSARAQNISGVINIYAQVLDVDTCLNQLTISDAAGFNVGDRVLIIQMKGAQIDESNTPSFGTVTNYGNAGNYEFGTIALIDGLQVTLKNKIVRLYDAPSGFVQLVRVPQYTDPVITSSVNAGPWDGFKGGIVVFEATGNITLNSNIDVRGKGFIGGQNYANGGAIPNLNNYSYPLQSDSAGDKGEGIAEVDIKHGSGRGPLANGGGGGNGQNSGGGGGSNSGSGGMGGDQGTTYNYSRLPIGGLGGRVIDYSVAANKIFFGGGGGAGQQNDNEGSNGGDGGGIVIIRANTLTGGGGEIIADGGSAKDAIFDGAGGGGAGGTIVLDVNQIKNNPGLSARGGNGGNNNATDTSNQHWCFAPGGGGSGGMIVIKGPTLPTSILNGGPAGLVTSSSLPCYNTTFGASGGTPGNGIKNNTIIDGTVPFSLPGVTTPRYTICAGDIAQLGVNGGERYEWTPTAGLDNASIANPKASPSVTTKYTVKIFFNTNCERPDTVLVAINPKPNPLIAGSDSVCSAQTFFYKVATFPGGNYVWTVNGGNILTGQGTEDIGVLWTNAGTGYVTIDVTAPGSTCEGKDSMSVNISPGVAPTISGIDTVCAGDTVMLTATPGYAKYIWSNGDSLQTIRVTTSGNYFAEAITSGGCTTYSDTVSVLIHRLPVVTIIPTAPIMADTGGIDTLALSAVFLSQVWSTGATTDTIFITDSGTYTVTITDSNGCPAIASINIPRDVKPPSITLSIDTFAAAPCALITIPIRIDTSFNMPPSGATDFITIIKFDMTILEPMDKSHFAISGRWGYDTIIGLRPDNQTLGYLQPGIQFGVYLGDSVATIIRMETFIFTNGKKVRIYTYDGLFQLSNLCTQGGARLFSPTDSILLKQNVPNPAQARTTITYQLIEDGNTKLWVTDILGRQVATLFDGYIQAGAYFADLNTSSLSEGNYFYILQTPTAVIRRMMRIQR